MGEINYQWWPACEQQVNRILVVLGMLNSLLFKNDTKPKPRAKKPKPRSRSHSATNWLRRNDPDYKQGEYSIGRGSVHNMRVKAHDGYQSDKELMQQTVAKRAGK